MLQTQDDIDSEKKLLREFMKRLQNIENEIAILQEDRKTLREEFKEKIDIKTLNLAISVAKAKARVAHKFTFDNMLQVLEDEGWMDKE